MGLTENGDVYSWGNN